MLASYLFTIITTIAVYVSAACTPAERLQDLSDVIFAYNQDAAGATAEAFKLVPFGSPDINGVCIITMYATLSFLVVDCTNLAALRTAFRPLSPSQVTEPTPLRLQAVNFSPPSLA